jgi:hypothetical protein
MNNFYEMATVVLGCVVVAQYVAIKNIKWDRHKILYVFERVAVRDWAVQLTKEGYEVVNEDGKLQFRAKRHG